MASVSSTTSPCFATKPYSTCMSSVPQRAAPRRTASSGTGTAGPWFRRTCRNWGTFGDPSSGTTPADPGRVVAGYENCEGFSQDWASLGNRELAGESAPAEDERDVAWELNVELVTPCHTCRFASPRGTPREALASSFTHSLQQLGSSPPIWTLGGPTVRGKPVSFGHLAVAVLNGALRPFLSYWNPLLKDRGGQPSKGRFPA